jgi:integrase
MVNRKISLCWYTKTPQGWRYFPTLFEMRHGSMEVQHGRVKEKGKIVEYPQGRYVLRSYTDGRKVYAPVETSNPALAVIALQRAKRVAVASGDPRARLAVLKSAAKAYIADCEARKAMEAAAQAKLVLNEFLPLCNVTYVRGIDRATVLAYHATLRKRGLSERTVANKHVRLRAFLRFCKVSTEFMPDAPKYEKGLPTIYTPAETTGILKVSDDYMRLVIELGLKLGLREQEITYAEWGDVNWDESVFRVQGKRHWGWKVKDSEMRDIPIRSNVLEHLKAWRAQHLKTRLIVGTSSDKPNQHFLRTLKRLARREGLNCGECDGCGTELQECENWTLHKLRRTFCTTVLRSGKVDPRTLQAWMGHSELSTTLRYMRPASAKEMQAKVNEIEW